MGVRGRHCNLDVLGRSNEKLDALDALIANSPIASVISARVKAAIQSLPVMLRFLN